MDKLSLEHIVKANPTAIITGFYALERGKQVPGRDNSVQQTSDKDLIIDPHIKSNSGITLQKRWPGRRDRAKVVIYTGRRTGSAVIVDTWSSEAEDRVWPTE